MNNKNLKKKNSKTGLATLMNTHVATLIQRISKCFLLSTSFKRKILMMKMITEKQNEKK